MNLLLEPVFWLVIFPSLWPKYPKETAQGKKKWFWPVVSENFSLQWQGRHGRISQLWQLVCGRSCSHYSNLRSRDEDRIEGFLSYNLQRTTTNELIYQLWFNIQRFQSLLKYCCLLGIKCPPHKFVGDVLYSNHSKQNSFCCLHLCTCFSVIARKTACH